MHRLMGFVAVAALSGPGILFASQAFAGPDEAHQDSFWANQSVPDKAYANHGAYLQVEPRDAQVSKGASGVDQADATNAYFNHSMGTMSAPNAVAEAPAPASDNGRYTATYQQQYMQMDPRDTKVAKQGSSDQNDIYLYHSMGTMSHP